MQNHLKQERESRISILTKEIEIWNECFDFFPQDTDIDRRLRKNFKTTKESQQKRQPRKYFKCVQNQ